MGVTFAKPPSSAPRKREHAGGNKEVPRDGNDRPRIIVDCGKCDATGKIPSEKVEGRLNKCPDCGPKNNDPLTLNLSPGKRFKSFTRVTTFIDVLDDKKNLSDWQMRNVLIGVALDPTFLKGVTDLDPENPEDKKVLSGRAEAAAEFAGASKKADQGTYLHELSELVDQNIPLPGETMLVDFLDMEAYRKATHPLLNIVHLEKLVVNDQYMVAGTPDRVSTVKPGVVLLTPDGDRLTESDLLITDLKTGRVDYGALKMAMQLSIYAQSPLYDIETGARIPMPNINLKWGLIMHVAAGSAQCDLYWADLTLGWQAVAVAKEVRALRSIGKRALIPVATD